MPAATSPTPTTAHRRRLREIWRSAGWPCRDNLEIELLAAGLIAARLDDQGRETLHLTQAGLQLLADTLQKNRAARSAHETLVARVAAEMARLGRIAWCGLALRAQVVVPAGSEAAVDAAADARARWVMAMPDVFSVRHTSVAAYLHSAVHEIKVRRSDLLADLRQPAKRAAYLDMAGECWYVLAEGVAEAEEIPAECGVMVARGDLATAQLEVLRAAPRRVLPHEAGLPFAVWMALARATPVAAEESPQRWLGEPGEDPDPPVASAPGGISPADPRP